MAATPCISSTLPTVTDPTEDIVEMQPPSYQQALENIYREVTIFPPAIYHRDMPPMYDTVIQS